MSIHCAPQMRSVLLPLVLLLMQQRVTPALELSVESTFLMAGGTQQLRVLVGLPGAEVDVADSPTILYETSNEEVLTVSETGLVRGEAVGRASVRVLYGNLVDESATLEQGTLEFIVGAAGDIDGDGLTDTFEEENELNPEDPLDAELDSDADGLSNLEELELGTDPREADTDLDGAQDGEEVLNGRNPLVQDEVRLDDTWQFEVNGRTIQAGPGGSFLIGNIPVEDNFGSDPQGSPPDQLSDRFYRVLGTSDAGGRTRYAYSEPFQVPVASTLTISSLTISDEPPPVPVSISFGPGGSVVEAGGTLQLSVQANYQTGTPGDVTQTSLYLSSNPVLARVTLDGVVSGLAAGTVFITVNNEGASAVKRIDIVEQVESVTVQGFVQFADGNPVAGAVVSALSGEAAVTDAEGFFLLTIATPEELDTISLRVEFGTGEDQLMGGTSVEVRQNGISDAGIITLGRGGSSGREFVVAFQAQSQTDMVPTLYISSGADTFGDVEVPGLGFTQPFAVTRGQVTEVELPIEVLLTTLDGVQPLGVKISAFDPVDVYGAALQPLGADIFTGLPLEALGTRHRVISFPSRLGAPSLFAVAATQDDTTVVITPSADVGSHPAGTPYEVMLNRMDVYEGMALAEGADLTGSLITSDKPVALFSGHYCANVPDLTFGFCDPLVQQVPPATAWGTQVISVPLQSRTGGDTFRILAEQDNTAVTISGLLPDAFSLQAGEVRQVQLVGVNQISADKPILVAQFSNGATFDGDRGPDPFMMLLVPSNQFRAQYTFATPSGNERFASFINVVATVQDAAAGRVLLNGQPMAAEAFHAVGDTGLAAAQTAIAAGSHTLSSQNPVGLYVYGFMTNENEGFPLGFSSDAYGYPGGMDF